MKRISNSLLLMLFAATLIKSAKSEKEFNLNFQQHDYQVKFERAEFSTYNKDYLRNPSMVTYKYNRTNAVCNASFTFIVDVGSDLEGIVQSYKFMSNEYRFFPIRFGANLCKALAADVGGSKRMLRCGNFTGCPLVKGKKQHICKWMPDQSKLPPFIPTGDYKLEIQVMHFSTEVAVLNLYVSVTRPIVKK